MTNMNDVQLVYVKTENEMTNRQKNSDTKVQ